MATQAVSSPWLSRFTDWIDERFPWKNAVLFFILYLTVAVLTRASQEGVDLHLSLFDLGGCFLAWSFFLLIRIFDEHKDYEKDLHNHPHRVLQSGRITLGHLKAVAAVALLVQGLVAVGLDGGFGAVTTAWIALLVWLGLMGKEFFCGEWLEQRLPLYAISHMAIMPFIVFWFAQLAAPGAQWNGPLIGLSALALISGFAFEITRKTWGPEEERDTVDSYARIFGLKRAITYISLLVLAMTGLQAYLVWALTGSLTVFGIAGLVLLAVLGLALKTLLAFRRAPSAEGREKNEAAVGIATLLGYVTLIVAVLSSQSFHWAVI
ncbi:UbiA family prenyltransferase [Marinobacteraceae bacterium S3BR75-40.1]